MSTDLQYLEEWIPERMDPGTVFVLENQTKLGNAQNPYVAVMSVSYTHLDVYKRQAQDAAGRWQGGWPALVPVWFVNRRPIAQCGLCRLRTR